MLSLVQNIIFPNLDVNATEKSYVRCEGGAVCNLLNHSITMPKGSSITLDTFYNSFDIGFWKKYTTVNSLILNLRGTGLVRVVCYVACYGLNDRAVEQFDLNLSESRNFPITSFNNNENGKIYFAIHALTDAELSSGCFFTDCEVTNDVKLGVVITHYNRKQQVLPAINRIENELTTQPEYRGKVSLVVVDNSQNILPNEVGDSVLIKNENLGGSGGFTRGLLYLKDNGYTHCLFADDDGSFEIDSIKRTYAFYSFLKEEHFDVALSGILMRVNAPNLTLEKGGFFNVIYCDPNKNWLDIDRFDNVLKADNGFDRVNYGAWCFFCFPIEKLKKWPFPFFVRGDDVLFSLQNEFRIATVCGIACYIDEYDVKECPLTKYLAYRGIYVNWVLWGLKKKATLSAIRQFSWWYFSSLLSYQYESAKAIFIAQKDMNDGGEVFLSDPYMIKTRGKISEFTILEKNRKAACTSFISPNGLYESKLRKFVRLISLQGLLIPSCFFKDTIILQRRGWRGIFRQIFLYKKVFYYCPYDQQGYVVTHDKGKILSGIFLWAYMVVKILFRFKPSQQALYKCVDELATEQFWRKTLLK